ncbi:MAG: protein-L-isoaspartate(D-aspartate) O-methyltransferase [Bacteroidetes bacterium]|nr:protein-L-isoaspartate(D-aspartate) O-methyltransferase [Bacteroidota bacterium]
MQRILTDTYKHKGMRKRLVSILKEKGINDQKILDAIGKVPRHFFLDEAFLEAAYEDQAFQIGEGQTITQPYTVAYQTELLDISRGQKILEIGTGSGYQASILAELGAKIFTIERNRILRDRADKLLKEIGYFHVKTFFGDGYKGLPMYQPFDRIIVTAGSNEIPKELINQLNVGGKLVMPIGDKNIQKMACLIKTSETEFEINNSKSFKFVPLLPGKVN